jgi:hypothetical protein
MKVPIVSGIWPAAQPPVRVSRAGEGARGNRDVPPVEEAATDEMAR